MQIDAMWLLPLVVVAAVYGHRYYRYRRFTRWLESQWVEVHDHEERDR